MISAIIAYHDGERRLQRCLESLEGRGIEILLVDNASRDGSLDLVRRRFPEVTVLPQPRNLGFGAANNLAAARASGDALLLLNADAWLESDALDRLAARLAQSADIGLVAPRLRYPDGRRQFVWSPARGVVGEAMQRLRNPFEASGWAHGGPARAVARLAGRIWFTAACVMVRAEAFRAVGGFDEGFFMYFEDVDLCMRLEAAGWRLAEEPRAVAVHTGGLTNRFDVDELYRPSQLRFYRRYRPGWETRYLERRLRRRYGDAAVERWLATEVNR